jgi:carboxymethylenebutenolidase
MGYLAIAPEFFVRAGDPNTLGTMAEILKEIVGKTPDEQVIADVQAGIDWAGKNGGDVKRVASLVFVGVVASHGWPVHKFRKCVLV